MKIALLGYGKMGRIIEETAISRGHNIVLKVDVENASTFSDSELQQADVAIEFTRPDAVLGNLNRCIHAHVPVVVGTTGWYDSLPGMIEECNKNKGTIFHASNFSIGVNLFFRLNEKLAELMNPFPEYEPILEEIHHIHKLDAPSGTGITLAHGLMAKFDRKKNWKLFHESETVNVLQNELPIISKRIGEVPGTHSVIYTSPIDQITITHEAYNRKGFALGAVIAAEWVHKKQGVFTMTDMLGE